MTSFRLPVLTSYGLVCLLWIAVSIFCWHYKESRNRYNNYLIFTGVYHHAIEQKNLYDLYPNEYEDKNHYGPLFSLVIAPFALMPDVVGLLVWNLVNALILISAVSLLPISRFKQWLLLLLCTIEFANAEHTIQFNQIITACIIFTFILVEKEKDEWATLLIVAGTLIKLYPVIGLAFLVFSKRKKTFLLTIVIWTAICLILPMALSGKHFVIQSYVDWFNVLKQKNAENVILGTSQDWSVMGTARAIIQDAGLPNMPFILIGALIFGSPLLRFNQYEKLYFRLNVLASSLLFVVLFSTGSEHPTFIIAVMGAFLWMLLRPRPFNQFNIFLMVLLLVLTGLGPSDAFPKFIRDHYIVPLAMKAWPCIIVWIKLSYDLLFSQFENREQTVINKQLTPASFIHAKMPN